MTTSPLIVNATPGASDPALFDAETHRRLNWQWLAFLLILSLLVGAGNAIPNGEWGTLLALVVLDLVLFVGPGVLNGLGRLALASILLMVLPTLALLLSYSQPLPNGQMGLTWTYAAGFCLPGLSLLIGAYLLPARWSVPLAMLALVSFVLLAVVMPHASSLVGEYVREGIISPATDSRLATFHATFALLFVPLVVDAALVGLGVYARSLTLRRRSV